LKGVEEADVIDSFSYASIEDWRKETPGKVIDSTLKVLFQSAEDQSSYMRNLVQQLRDHAGGPGETAHPHHGEEGLRGEGPDTSPGEGGARRLVWIRDWNRTVGVNMIINLDKAAADVGIRNPIVVATKFSEHAKSYANRRGVTLISRRELHDSVRKPV
jgi:hypothetical protein